MPNEVYFRTRDALATLVSERAATRVLDAALRRSHENADALDERTMRHLLLGPIQSELEGILPRTGLRRTLRRLARQVADEGRSFGGPVTPARAGLQERSHTVLNPVTRSSVYLPDAAPPMSDEPPSETAAATRSPPAAAHRRGDPSWRAREEALAVATADAGDAAAPAPARGRRRGRDRSHPTVVPHPLGAEALDAFSVHFAEVEGVLQVIALRATGEPQVRGTTVDADALAPLAQSAVRLLGRFGPLRSLVLEHEAGLLFIFPLGRDAIAVLARANVNMGAVFAARAALEEGP